MNVELVIDAKATVGEGAIWDARRQRLYWVDIVEGLVQIYDPANQTGRPISCPGSSSNERHHCFCPRDKPRRIRLMPMKLGLGLHRCMATRENFRFARQAGCTHALGYIRGALQAIESG